MHPKSKLSTDILPEEEFSESIYHCIHQNSQYYSKEHL